MGTRGHPDNCVAVATIVLMPVVAPAGELLSFVSPKESNQRKGDPDAALILRAVAFDGDRQKGLPAPLPMSGIHAAPLRAIPAESYGARRGIREKNRRDRSGLFVDTDDIQKPSNNFVGVRIMTDSENSKAHSTVRSSPRDATENVLPHWDPTTELDAICRNVEELRHSGASEEAITAHFGEQLQALTARQNKETAEVLAEIYAPQACANGFVFPKRNRLSIIALAAVFAGFSLELTIGNQFVFSAANQYRATLPWLIAFLAIISAWIWFSLERKNHTWAKHYPTWWVRWFLVFPGMVATSSVIVAISPLGWLALYGWIFGAPTEGLEAKMLSVAAYHSGSRGCHQNAEIIINGNSATICLDKAILGRVPTVGETVTVTGRISRAGVFIDEVRAR